MIADFILQVINWVILGLGVVLGWLIEIFPDSPWAEPSQPPEGVILSNIAWVIPYGAMVQHLLLICTAVLAYYLIRVLARWIKLVRS